MLKRSTISKSMLSSDSYLPKYEYHLTDNVVGLKDGRMIGVISFQGVPFDVIPDGILDNNYDTLNGTVMRIAKGFASRLEMWGHLDHFKTEFDGKYLFKYKWLSDFNSRYIDKLKEKDSYENIFYLTFILKPDNTDLLDDTIRDLQEILSSISQAFGGYEPKILSSYKENGYEFSEVYEFLGYLHNGFWEKIPVTSLPANEVIPSTRIHFDYRGLEFRFPDGGSKYAAYYDLKDFPEYTTRGMLNPLLEADFAFIMVVTFSFLAPAAAIKLINAQSNKLESSGDEADGQISESEGAKGSISAGEIYFGLLHAGLAVFGDNQRSTDISGGKARTTLSSFCGALFNRANVTAPETFYSFFPANILRRPRVSPKTTRNFFGLFSMNTYSSGKQRGNPIGDGTAVIPLETSGGGVFHFNFHYSSAGKDSMGEKIAGHTFILGETGSGKTTLQTTLLAQLDRFDTKIFALDREGSMRGLIEALGGKYFTLEAGQQTGLNPFQLPINVSNREFLYDLVSACGKRREALTSEDKKDIKSAVDSVLGLPFNDRRFGMLLQSIPDRGVNSLHKRLEEWCYGESESEDGRLAYALDCPSNNFDPEEFNRVGFDVKDFLKEGNPVTEPLLAYLLHLKSLMQRTSGILVTVIEEFWLPISYPTTAAQIKDILKTGRRRDEFLLLVSQSPADVIKSPLIADILEQTQTQILLANPNAVYSDPVSGMGYDNLNLTKKEFDKLPKDKYLRQFLIKQGNQSTVAKLDLSGLDEFISVMAMAAEDFPYLEQAKLEVGQEPDLFVPRYIELRKAARTISV